MACPPVRYYAVVPIACRIAAESFGGKFAEWQSVEPSRAFLRREDFGGGEWRQHPLYPGDKVDRKVSWSRGRWGWGGELVQGRVGGGSARLPGAAELDSRRP